MTKQEFLAGLEEALAGEVSQQVLLENMRYYRSYIDGEVEKGRSEAEVLNELGSPRLIARTIADATEAGAESTGSWGGFDGRNDAGGYTADAYEETRQQQNGYGTDEDRSGGPGVFWLGSSGCWWLVLVLVILIVCVISVVVRFVYTFPGLVVLGIILYVVHSRRNRRY